MKTTLDLPESLLAEATRASILRHQSLQDFLADIIKTSMHEQTSFESMNTAAHIVDASQRQTSEDIDTYMTTLPDGRVLSTKNGISRLVLTDEETNKLREKALKELKVGLNLGGKYFTREEMYEHR